jgi:hypothetical protein
MTRYLLLLAALFLFALPVAAEEEAEKEKTANKLDYTYAPENCDFQISFPEEPYAGEKCQPGSSKCRKIINFTEVFESRTTVNFLVTCNPSSGPAYKQYDESTMKAILKGMVSDNAVSGFEIRYDEYDDAKIASLTGAGETGVTPMIYTGQIWLGQNSVFTIEGELIGRENEAADRLFADILNSIKSKNEAEASVTGNDNGTTPESTSKNEAGKANSEKSD